VTDRKPPGLRFETWIDRQVREGIDHGRFDNLPGTGKPIPGIDRPHDDSWWVKEKLRRERVSVLPPTLALRKEVEEARRRASQADSEVLARRIVEEINEKIRDAIVRPLAGPPLNLVPLNVERTMACWRADHPAVTPAAPPATDRRPAPQASWWRRSGRRH
jgi:hypothetical protein